MYFGGETMEKNPKKQIPIHMYNKCPPSPLLPCLCMYVQYINVVSYLCNCTSHCRMNIDVGLERISKKRVAKNIAIKIERMKDAWKEGLWSALGGSALILYQTAYRKRNDRAREQLVVRLATTFPPR